MKKKLWSYFNHWRLQNVHYHDTVRTTLSDRLIKLYHSWIRIAFKRWKLLHDQDKTEERQEIVQTLQDIQLQHQNDIIENTNIVNFKVEELRQCRERHLIKCVEGFETRFKSISIGRWRDNVNQRNIKEKGAFIIMRRLRLRLLRKAIDLYQEGLEYRQLTMNQEQRCQNFRALRNKRTLATMLNSWQIYKANYLKAKDYWYRIFLRLDLTMKRLSLKRWKEKTELSVESSLNNHE
jgi:hypothetical protein